MLSCTPFVRKTYHIVSDKNTNQLVSWSNLGDSFIIWDEHMFQQNILSKYFKHSNLCSFVRQLNTYGFHKISGNDSNTNILEFAHPDFKYNSEHLLYKITRKSKKVPTKIENNPPTTTTVINNNCSSVNSQMSNAICDLMRRQEESEKQLKIVCKELDEAKSVIELMNNNTNYTDNNNICGKRMKPDCKVDLPSAKIPKYNIDLNEPLSFDNLLQIPPAVPMLPCSSAANNEAELRQILMNCNF